MSPGNLNRPNAPTDAPLTPSSLHNTESPEQPGVNGHQEPSLDAPINFNHMELLAHLTIDKDMFNLGVDIEDYYAALSIGLKTSLTSPYLLHQLLAYSARHLAFLHPECREFYNQQAVILQTRAVSLFTAIPITVNQFNCMPILLFSSLLGHHLLADTLATRDPCGLDGFVNHFVQCAQTYRGVYTIAKSAWPLLMESELGPIMSLSANFTSRPPQGNDCQRVSELVDSATDLSEEDRDGCKVAIRYVQVGLDAVSGEESNDVARNRFQMISEWTMLVPPEFTRLLADKRPEALIVLAHYALLLHYGRRLWWKRGSVHLADHRGRPGIAVELLVRVSAGKNGR